MNCFDCMALLELERPAAGICKGCGAGVCLDHAVVRERTLVRYAVINREEPVEPAARRLVCATCDAAEVAAGLGSRARDRIGDVVGTTTHLH